MNELSGKLSKALAIAALVAAGWCAWNELEWLSRAPVSKVIFTLALAVAALAVGLLLAVKERSN